jgi:hypothetical protein
MTIRVIALGLLALGLACAGCSQQPAPEKPPLYDTHDGCNQDSDLAFRNQVASGPPFKGASELDHDELLLTVDPNQWNNLGLGMHQQLVAIFDCGDAGPGRFHSNIYVRSTDGTDLMKVSTPELRQFRAEGLSDVTKNGLRAGAVAAAAQVQIQSQVDPNAQ